jgi:hypothetical protein
LYENNRNTAKKVSEKALVECKEEKCISGEALPKFLALGEEVSALVAASKKELF